MALQEMEVGEKVEKAFSKYPKRSYSKGQILIFADENPEYIFYITKGRVREYDVSYRGDEVIVNIFKPPSFFPMSWAINQTQNKYFYKTETDTDVHIIPLEVALDFIKANPDVILVLLSRVYRGMDVLLGRVVQLMSGTAKSRVAYELVVECRRSGESKGGRYLISLKENDLAARTGLSRETISRELNKLKKQGLVKITTKGVVVNDLPVLESKLNIKN